MYRFLHTGWQEMILFQSWRTDSWPGLCEAFVAVAGVAAMFEAIKSLSSSVSESDQSTTVSTPLLVIHSHELHSLPCRPPEGAVPRHYVQYLCGTRHAVRTVLYVVQMTLRYMLMLIVMTFNVSLVVSVVVGSSVGHFVFFRSQSSRATST